MGHVAEAVLGADLIRPRFESRWPLDLDGPTALPADQVMVVLIGAAGALEGLAILDSEDIDLTLSGHGLEIAIDRGQTDGLACSREQLVQLLG